MCGVARSHLQITVHNDESLFDCNFLVVDVMLTTPAPG